MDLLIWDIWFEQNQTTTPNSTNSFCRVISVDLLSGQVIYDMQGQFTRQH